MREMSKKIIVGVTGNIASGKSAVTDYLTSLGYHVIDTDIITQDVYDNSECFRSGLIKLLGDDIIEDDVIDKKKVANIVFNDKNKLERLNELAHPIIKKATLDEIAKYDGIVFVAVPLLFEAGFDDFVDYIIVVQIERDNQLVRLMKRNNLSESEANLRIDAQVPQEEKIKKADYVLDNNLSTEELHQQIDVLLNELERK